MSNKVNFKNLIKKHLVSEGVHQHMDDLLNYFDEKPVTATNPIVRLSLAKFVSNPEIYDYIFDQTGEFVDLNEITDDAQNADRIFGILKPEDQEKFKKEFVSKKVEDPILEPSYKIMTVKSQYPEDTLMVRFVGDGQLERTQKDGFTMGTKDMDRLHATEYYGKEHKSGGGYIYAYLANSREAKKQAKAVEVGENYGENCVFFKYPGVEVYHRLDGEDQIIVYGPDLIPENCIFVKGVDEGQFVILNAGFDKTPKEYNEVIKILQKI